MREPRENSTAQICWYEKNKLQLRLVNESRESYFIFAEKIIAMYEYPETKKQVKKQNTVYSENTRVHQGEIVGIINEINGKNRNEDEEIELLKVTLYFVDYNEKVNYKVNDEKLKCTEIREFIFNKYNLSILITALDIMQNDSEYLDNILTRREY